MKSANPDLNVHARVSTAHAESRIGSSLLRWGAMAGPLYLLVGLVQVMTRDGFDMRRHALSHLANGDLGWIQIVNFLVAGVLVLLGAVGVRRVLAGSPGGTWGPILLGLYGAGLVGAGVFVADPAPGFPPGTALEPGEGMSRSGLLHFVAGGIAFYALIGACFVFARRFARLGERAYAWYSGLTGLAFFASFAAVASGTTSPAVLLTFYGAVAWVWAWHAVTHIKLLRASRLPAVAAPHPAGHP